MRKNYLIYIFVFITYLFVLDNNVYADNHNHINDKIGWEETCADIGIDTDWWLFEPTDYDKSCLYVYDFSKGIFGSDMALFNSKNYCVVAQVSYNEKDEKMEVRSNVENWGGSATVSASFDAKTIISSYGLYCPRHVDLDISVLNKFNDSNFNLNLGKKFKNRSMNLKNQEPKTDLPNLIKKDSKNEITDCKEIITGDARDILKSIITLIRIAVPIILVAMGVVDFGGAIFAGDEDKMKKSQSKFIKRVMIAVAFFLIPVVLKFVLGIAYDIWGIVDPTLCGLI